MTRPPSPVDRRVIPDEGSRLSAGWQEALMDTALDRRHGGFFDCSTEESYLPPRGSQNTPAIRRLHAREFFWQEMRTFRDG